MSDYSTGNPDKDADIHAFLNLRADRLQTFARVRGIDGRGDMLDVVRRLVADGHKPSDVPEQKQQSVSNASQALVNALQYR